MSKQDLQCPFCPKTSPHGAGLASHIRNAHPKHHSAWSKARKSGRAVAGGATKPAASAGGFGEIVASLERQKSAIDSALTALRAVGGEVGTNETVARKRGRPRKVR
jgi:hypothetical protein